MSLSSEIARLLPELRRFSRALSGDQESGDRYVVALLEAFVADPETFDRDVPLRIALYRAFLKMWGSASIDGRAAVSGTAPADRLLSAITPLPRQAFLLVSMEGFTVAEAAQILSVTPERVAALIETASQQIAEQIATDVLIIEDEPLIALDLERLTSELGHRVIATARTEREALDVASRQPPGLILADIQLADGSSGLSAVKEILGRTDVPVIFVTAYPERLLTGERPEPTLLIAKPFVPEKVKAVISQALFLRSREADGRAA